MKERARPKRLAREMRAYEGGVYAAEGLEHEAIVVMGRAGEELHGPFVFRTVFPSNADEERREEGEHLFVGGC